MILTRAPLRMSFAGGGSDLPAHYLRHGGCVLSAAINRYVYIAVHPYFEGGEILLKYSETEKVRSAAEVRHPLIREALRLTGIESGLEITSMADVPAGTGLGSSSSFTVALLQALYACLGKVVSKNQLARDASLIEIDCLREPIGKQDQYASAFGGINFIRFCKDDRVEVTPLLFSSDLLCRLERNLIAFYTGGAREASSILAQQYAKMLSGSCDGLVRRLAALAEELQNAFLRGQLDALGELMDEGWRLKKSLAPGISNSSVDHMYARAMEAGALGGKLLGAGGHGFLLFYCPEERQDAVRAALYGLREHRFSVDIEGARIVYMGDAFARRLASESMTDGC